MANEFKVRKGLIVTGSGSTIFDVQGSQGQLFSVTDSLVGELFSVNDISGIPILTVSSDDSVLMGTYGAEAVIVSGSNTTITNLIITGTTLVSNLNADYLDGQHGSYYASAASLSSYVPTSRTLTINGTTFDLSTNRSWTIAAGTGTVTQVNSGNGMNFSNFTTSGTITMGTPSSTTLASTNATTTNSHTHAFAPGGTTAQYITGAGTLVTFPTIPTVNNGTLTMGTSGIATGSASFTANQSGGSTFTVNVPATNLSIGVSSGTQVRVDSSTGTNVDIPVASATLAGIVTTGAQTFAGTKTFSSTISGNISGSAASASDATNAGYIAVTEAATTNANYYITFSDATNTNSRLWSDSTRLYYNPSINTLYSTNFNGLATNATQATNSSNVAITNNTTTNATYYLTFTSGLSGNQALNVDSSTLTFNPSTNTLTVANLAGNASSATNATNATNVAVTNNTTTNATYYLTFTSGVSGNQALQVDSSALTFNPNTNTLTVANLAGTNTVTSSNYVSAGSYVSANSYVVAGTYGLFRGNATGDRVYIGDPGSNGPIGIWEDANGTGIAVYDVANAEFQFANRTIRGRISNGYVCVGDSPSGAGRFEVRGDNGGGGVSIYATDDIVAFSDISVKENIRPIANVIDKIVNSRGVIYDRIDSKTKNNIGFIAQELEEQFPELVTTNPDGTKAVKYQNATAVLFEAVKEQQKQIDSLQEQINNILAKLDK